MFTIWDSMGTWGDRVGGAALSAVDDVSTQALGWLDEALDGRDPDEVLEFLAELDRVPLLSALIRDTRCRQPGFTAVHGDIIGVQRLGYTHYGIYVCDDEVIHYVGSEDELSMDATIQTTTMTTFLRKDTELFVLDVTERAIGNMDSLKGDFDIVETFSPDETVRRAQSRLGESRYNLLWNNCEHFALWCKTGKEESDQVASAFEALGHVVRQLVEKR